MTTQILTGGLAAAPFLIVRCVYGIIEYTRRDWLDSQFNPVFGSAVTFSLMALLMEYIAICIWLVVGYTTPADRGVRAARTGSSDVDTKEQMG